MIADSKYQFAYRVLNETSCLLKGTWLVILHASRIPPHVGLMINGNYNSLTIKERELNVKAEALLKTISQKKIETLFFKIVKHPVFSEEHQMQIFQEQLQLFTVVKQNEATCLSPIKLFFEEFYAVRNNKELLLYDFIEELNDNDYIGDCVALNGNSAKPVFTFKTYSAEQLQERIKEEREFILKHNVY